MPFQQTQKSYFIKLTLIIIIKISRAIIDNDFCPNIVALPFNELLFLFYNLEMFLYLYYATFEQH